MENINPNSDQKYHSNDVNVPIPWPWKRLVQFARQPDTNHPSRDETQEQRYSVYKKWCLENDLSNAGYIRKFVSWHPVWDVGLEPCLVPYHLESDIKHFILWFNDRSWGSSGFTPKKQNVCQDEFGNSLSESDFVWHMVQNFVPSYKNKMKVALQSDDESNIKNSDFESAFKDNYQHNVVVGGLSRNGKGNDEKQCKDEEASTVENGAPSRDIKSRDRFPNEFENEVIWYENHPDWKSIPEIKHLQIFFHTSVANEDVKKDLESIETAWIDRSAFLKHEKV